MILQLTRLPELRAPSEGYNGIVPTRMRFLAPDAAESLLKLERDTGGFVYTDIFRGAKATLDAFKNKGGTQPPGYSAHGFGLSVDVDVAATCALRRMRYPEMADTFAQYGWYCHRRGLSRGLEEWHFNFLGPTASLYLNLAIVDNHATWSRPIEERIHERYASAFQLDLAQAQAALAKLGYYRDTIDGVRGAHTQDALKAFQTDWALNRTADLNERTCRTLAYVAAEISLQGEGQPVA